MPICLPFYPTHHSRLCHHESNHHWCESSCSDHWRSKVVQPCPNLHDDEPARVPSCNWTLRKTTVCMGQGYERIAVVDRTGLQVGLVESCRRHHHECCDEVRFCCVTSAWFRSKSVAQRAPSVIQISSTRPLATTLPVVISEVIDFSSHKCSCTDPRVQR